MRQISDRICDERGLSVIQTDKGKGMSHYEADKKIITGGNKNA